MHEGAGMIASHMRHWNGKREKRSARTGETTSGVSGIRSTPEPRDHVFHPSHEPRTALLLCMASAQLLFHFLVVDEKLGHGLEEGLKRVAG